MDAAEIIELKRYRKLSGKTVYGIPVEVFSDPELMEEWQIIIDREVKKAMKMSHYDVDIL